MSTNPTGNLVKWWPSVSDEPTANETALHTRMLYNTANDHDQAITLLKGQIDDLVAGARTSITTFVSSGSSGPTPPAPPNPFPGLGAVNDQSGMTAYTVQSSDNGALVIFSDASPIAVTLNSALTTPYFVTLSNRGSGTATVTPSTGLVNGGASLAIPEGYDATFYFDGANWDATVLPTVPVNTPGVTHEWLASYNATTGVFTLSQPAFIDISGVASAAQLPVATTAAFGAVKPDNSTITITAGVISAVAGGGGVTRGVLNTNANGSWYVWSDGVIEQWGSISVAPNSQNKNSAIITFPTPFTSAVGSLQTHINILPRSASSDGASVQTDALTLSGATAYLQCNIPTGGGGATFDLAVTIFWRAIGK